MMTRDTQRSVGINALQTGMGWLPDQAGGLNRYFHDWVRALHSSQDDRSVTDADRTFRFEHWVAGPPGRRVLSDRPRVRSFADRRWPIPRRCLAARRMLHRASAGRVDLVVSHFALYTAPGLGYLDGLPLVVHFHGPWAAESAREGGGRIARAIKRRMEGSVYRRAERVIALSQAFADLAVRDYDVDRSRIRVVPGGVDLGRFCPIAAADGSADSHVGRQAATRLARRRLGWDPDRPTLVCVRRLVKRMGIKRLIAAMTRLRSSNPDLQLMIGGRGPLAGPLQGQIDAAGLSGNVRLIGYIADEDLPWVYRAADLSVVPTEALEGFGLIAAESLAVGTPCLVTPVGGLPEVVGELSRNLVCDAAEADAIADRVATLINAPESLPDVDVCRRYAESRFDWRIVGKQILGVYREAIDAAPDQSARSVPTSQNASLGTA